MSWPHAMHAFTTFVLLHSAVVLAVNGTSINESYPSYDIIIPTESSILSDHQGTILPPNESGDEDGQAKAVTYPCRCFDGICSCCTGNILQNFNVNMRQRLCTNLTFDPEDLTIGLKVLFNDRVLYQNRVSGKNPPPICLPIPRLTALRVCIRLTNVYFIGRNVHACVIFETQWNKEAAFAFNFDCVRLGRDGIAIVKPEDGGGLPNPTSTSQAGEDEIEDYDENVVTVDKPPLGRK